MSKMKPITERKIKAGTNIVKTIANKALEHLLPFYKTVKDISLSAWANSRNVFFDEFLLGLDGALPSANDDEKEQIYKEFESRENDIILGEIVNSVLFSKGTKSRVILGLIAAKYLGGAEIDYIDTLILAALKELFDDEIALFKRIQDYHDTKGTDLTNLLRTERMLMAERLDRLNLIKIETMYENNITTSADLYGGGGKASKMQKALVQPMQGATPFPVAVTTSATARFLEYIEKSRVEEGALDEH